MKKLLIFFVSLLFCLTASGCKGGLPGYRTLVTALELEYGAETVTARLEYRKLAGAEEPEEYGTCSGTGRTVPEAVQAVSIQEGKKFYFPSCSVLILSGSTRQGFAELLRQANAIRELRPLTMVCLSERPLLAEEREPGQSVGKSVETLSRRWGWNRSGAFTLKGAVSGLADGSLSLPAVTLENGEAAPMGFVLIGTKGQLFLTPESCIFLPEVPLENNLTVHLPECGGVMMLETLTVRPRDTGNGYEIRAKASGRWILPPASAERAEQEAGEWLLSRLNHLRQASEAVGADCWKLEKREELRKFLPWLEPREKQAVRVSVSLHLKP